MPREKGAAENVSLFRRTVVRRVEDNASDPELHLQHRGVDLMDGWMKGISYFILTEYSHSLSVAVQDFPMGENKY